MDTTHNYTEKRKQLLFLGDIHGQFESIAQKIEKLGIENAYIIQVGDTGFGFLDPKKEAQKTKILNNVLVSQDIEMFMMRGNHCDPSFFKIINHPYGHSNITLLPDYSELNINGLNILLIGGAISIDRIYRVEDKSWWRGEPFLFDENFNYGKYDIIATHTRPTESGIYLSKKGISAFLDKDKDLSADIDKENAEMSKLYNSILPPKFWVFGHFHDSLTTKVGETTFKLLGIDEFWELPQFE